MVPVLFIDADEELHTSLTITLPGEFVLLSAYSGNRGIEMIQTESPEIILVGNNLPDIHGSEILRKITAIYRHPPVIMVSDSVEIAAITDSIRMGAHDYIKKPIEIKRLKTSIMSALQYKAARESDEEEEHPALASVIGRSDQMMRVKQQVARYAPSDHPILLTGESGTDKEVIAAAIHHISCRSNGPFLAINCGAVPQSLINTELFGSEKGAYTDAVLRPGSFEQANGGTLFLDEIGEMDAAVQVHLLRVIESKEIIRVGGVRRIRTDTRIITATNKDLRKAIQAKEFRQDLYFRINTLEINIPPLRERTTDIPALVKHFIEKSGNREYVMSVGAMQKLYGHSWPGNIRELKATIERALLHCDGHQIDSKHIVFSL